MSISNYAKRILRWLRSQAREFTRNTRRKIRAISNRRRSLVSVEMHGRIPRLILHDKYEKKVKWALRLLTSITIVLSLVSIPVWYISLAVALGLTALGRFLEGTVFHYTSLYVMPMPTFTYDPDQWIGMLYAFEEQTFDIVGPAFRDRSYAVEFLELLRAWNYNEPEDDQNNIHLSFILEEQSEYAVYLYPDMRRKSASKFFDEMEEKGRKASPSKRHQPWSCQ